MELTGGGMRRVGFVAYPGFAVMGFAQMAVFEAACGPDGEPRYDVRLVSESGGSIRSSLGMAVQTEAIDAMLFDTIIIGGGKGMPFTPGLLDCLRRAARNCRRLGSNCTGAFFLAEAGLLNGLRATTHWRFADQFRARYPGVRFEPERLFVVDGSVWTSAGIDQSLTMVEEDLGAEAAREVSRRFLLHGRRRGCQPQSSVLLDICPKTDRIQDSLAYARSHLHARLTIAVLAEAARLSPRQFSRAFRLETGISPAKAVEKLRVEAARALVQEGRHSIEDIARQTGFGDTERMRRAFVRAFGDCPQMVRRIARGRESEPASGSRAHSPA